MQGGIVPFFVFKGFAKKYGVLRKGIGFAKKYRVLRKSIGFAKRYRFCQIV